MTGSPLSTRRGSTRETTPTLGRRALLAGAGTVALGGLAGCSTVADFVASRVLEDVNLFNETDGRLEGSIEVVGPSEDVVLSERFELEASSQSDAGTGGNGTEGNASDGNASGGASDDGGTSDGNETDDAGTSAGGTGSGTETGDGDGAAVEEEPPQGAALETYADVWQGAGDYAVTVTLDEGFEIEGTAAASTTVTVDDPDEEVLAVFFGVEDGEPISFAVGEGLTDLQPA